MKWHQEASVLDALNRSEGQNNTNLSFVGSTRNKLKFHKSDLAIKKLLVQNPMFYAETKSQSTSCGSFALRH